VSQGELRDDGERGGDHLGEKATSAD